MHSRCRTYGPITCEIQLWFPKLRTAPTISLKAIIIRFHVVLNRGAYKSWLHLGIRQRVFCAFVERLVTHLYKTYNLLLYWDRKTTTMLIKSVVFYLSFLHNTEFWTAQHVKSVNTSFFKSARITKGFLTCWSTFSGWIWHLRVSIIRDICNT